MEEAAFLKSFSFTKASAFEFIGQLHLLQSYCLTAGSNDIMQDLEAWNEAVNAHHTRLAWLTEQVASLHNHNTFADKN